MSENSETRLSCISKADSYEAIGEFWDTHSSADYWDQGYDVELKVGIPRRRRINIEADLFARIAEEARRRGISPETLVNLWMAERLHGLAAQAPTPAPEERRTAAQPEMQLAEAGEAHIPEKSQG